MQELAQDYISSPDMRFAVFAVIHVTIALLTIHTSNGTWRLRRLPFFFAATGVIVLSYAAIASAITFAPQFIENAAISMALVVILVAIKSFVIAQLISARCRDYSQNWKLHASVISALFVVHNLSIFIASFRPSQSLENDDLEEQFA